MRPGSSYEVYILSLEDWLRYSVQGAAVCGLTAYVFYRSLIAFLIFLPFGICYPLYQRKYLQAKRLERLLIQFKEGIIILSSSLSAGYSVENAFASAVKELTQLFGKDEMITKEFASIVRQVKTNRPVEAALREFADRSGLDDVKNFADIFAAAKRSGGELVHIISHVSQIIGDKIQVREEIITMTTEKRFEQNIMNMVPFLIVIYIDFTTPGFFDVMYQTFLGRIVMSVCLAVYLLAYWTSQKLLEIEV